MRGVGWRTGGKPRLSLQHGCPWRHRSFWPAYRGGLADAADGDRPGRAGATLFVVTDGQVSGTERIIESALAEGVRIHCLGIGSASQDRFLSMLARETGGVSRFLTPRERVDLGAVELGASVGRPLASGFEAKAEGFPEAQIAPLPPKFVFSGTPVLLTGETSGPGFRPALPGLGRRGEDADIPNRFYDRRRRRRRDAPPAPRCAADHGSREPPGL